MDFMFVSMISSIMFTVVPLMMLFIIGYMVYTKVSSNRYNRSQPRLSVMAKVVAKRSHVGQTGVNHMDDMGSHHSYTDYYITFEVASGDRMELHIPASEYGMIVEGDEGQLSFQGNEYLGFKRT